MNVTAQIKKRLSPVLRRYQIEKAILFGSFARADASPRSDLDLILIQRSQRRFFERYDGLLTELTKAIPERDLEVLIYTPEELAQISSRPFIAQALREGMVIYESSRRPSRG